MVRSSTWDKDASYEASHPLVVDAVSPTEAAPVATATGPGGPSSGNWLLRIGAGQSTSSSSARRITSKERARHAILSWRLERPYLLYCLACASVTAFLLAWNVVKGVQNSWNLPQWKHHRWEEALEVGIGVLIFAETMLTMRVLGARDFFSNGWCIFDFCVAALTVVSIGYGLEHLGRKGEICEANIPLLTLRFVLQPARVLAVAASTYRTRQMQNQVDELRVDFGSLELQEGYECMQEMI